MTEAVKLAHEAHEALEHGVHHIDATARAYDSIANERTGLLARQHTSGAVNANEQQMQLVEKAERTRRLACWLWLLPVVALAPTIAFIVMFARDTSSALWMALMIVSIVLWAFTVVLPCAIIQSVAASLKHAIRRARIEAGEYVYSTVLEPEYWVRYCRHSWGKKRTRNIICAFVASLIFFGGGTPLCVYVILVAKGEDDISKHTEFIGYIAAGVIGGIVLLFGMIALAEWRRRSLLLRSDRRLVLFEDALICGTLYLEWPMPPTSHNHIVGFLMVNDPASQLDLLTVVRQSMMTNGRPITTKHVFPLPPGAVADDELAATFGRVAKAAGRNAALSHH